MRKPLPTFVTVYASVAEASVALDTAVDFLHELREDPRRVEELDAIATLLRNFVEEYA